MIEIIMTLCALGVINMAICLILAKNIGRIKDETEQLILLAKLHNDQLQQIYEHSVFTNDAMELLLWKTRQEVYTWQRLWAQTEQYEAAEQAKMVIQQAEAMINYHRNKLKQNGRVFNQGNNEPTV